MHVFNMFVSSTKHIHLQCQKRLFLDQHKMRSSLGINAFVCSVISYSEVSSRGYLVLSNDTFVCSVISYLEVKIGLETPQKEQKLREKVSEKTSFRVGMELKKYTNREGMRKPQEPYPTTERCLPPLWPPMQCTCIPTVVCFVVQVTK